jgi:drug/metabolite transporter (DMT)-like permease
MTENTGIAERMVASVRMAGKKPSFDAYLPRVFGIPWAACWPFSAGLTSVQRFAMTTAPSSTPHPAYPAKGIACMVAGGALLTLNDALMKWLVGDYAVGQILFMRSLFMLAAVLIVAWRAGGLLALRPRNMPGQLVRGTMVVTSTFCFVTGLQYLSLADAVVVSFCGPLFITALATPLLAETVGWRRWVAVIVGFAGVVFIFRPTGETIQWAALWPLAASLSGALRDILTRRLCATETSLSILLLSTSVVALVGLTTAPFGWPPLAAKDLGLLALAGFLLFGAHYLLIEAFRQAEAALVAPFKYSNVVWGILFGFLMWGHVPDSWTMAGTVVIVGSGIYILGRETRRRARPA